MLWYKCLRPIAAAAGWLAFVAGAQGGAILHSEDWSGPEGNSYGDPGMENRVDFGGHPGAIFVLGGDDTLRLTSSGSGANWHRMVLDDPKSTEWTDYTISMEFTNPGLNEEDPEDEAFRIVHDLQGRWNVDPNNHLADRYGYQFRMDSTTGGVAQLRILRRDDSGNFGGTAWIDNGESVSLIDELSDPEEPWNLRLEVVMEGSELTFSLYEQGETAPLVSDTVVDENISRGGIGLWSQAFAGFEEQRIENLVVTGEAPDVVFRPSLALDRGFELVLPPGPGKDYLVEGSVDEEQWEAIVLRPGSEDAQSVFGSSKRYPFQRVFSDPDWEAPTGGWNVSNYEASSGLFPYEASPPWNFAMFAEPYDLDLIDLVTDDLTGETVLFLEARPGTQDNFVLNPEYGAGTAEDLMTLDFRFRFPDKSRTARRFTVHLWRPTDGTDNQRTTFYFSMGQVEKSVPGEEVSAAYNFGTHWNNVRLIMDVPEQTYGLYVNGDEAPLLSGATRLDGGGPIEGMGERNAVSFGHQDGSVAGTVKLAHFRVTDSELAVTSQRVVEEFERRDDVLELVLSSEAAGTFRLESSDDLTDWLDEDESISLRSAGTASSFRRIENDRKFFRFLATDEE